MRQSVRLYEKRTQTETFEMKHCYLLIYLFMGYLLTLSVISDYTASNDEW